MGDGIKLTVRPVKGCGGINVRPSSADWPGAPGGLDQCG
ncbi:hypothetical protein FBY14_104213 [Azospirillum brasilense]|nr:hypothetical protein FBY14_104213 [Azospirillum brasilense]